MKIKGMLDTPTLQGLVNRSVPGSREQAVSELARLEHEKARLSRERDMWIANQRTTESRLRRVEERISLLWQAVGHQSEREEPAAVNGSNPGTPERTETNWRAISLEY